MTAAGRILVVDDEVGMCEGCRRILAGDGHAVDTATSGRDALARLVQRPYDVVITDQRMPEVGGIELLEKVRSQSPEIAVILMSGYATVDTAVQAMKLGAFDYLTKPFSPDQLSEATRKALALRQAAGTEAFREMVRFRMPPAAPVESPTLPGDEEPALDETGDLYVLANHAWARVEADGTVTVGLHGDLVRQFGCVLYVDLPLEGEEVAREGLLARVSVRGWRIHRLLSPVAGVVTAVNEELDRSLAPIEEDPYGRGWVARIRPVDLETALAALDRVQASGGAHAA